MTNYSGNQDKDRQSTDEAWAKIQSKLDSEPANLVWASWGGESPDNLADSDFELEQSQDRKSVV